MKTYTLQSEQQISHALLVLGFLDSNEIRFNCRLFYDKEKSMYKISKDVDLVHSITFDFPVKDFKIMLDNELVFESSSLVTKIVFIPSLCTFMYKTLWIDFKHFERNFDLIGLQIAEHFPLELKPDPIINCSVFKERSADMFQQHDKTKIKVYETDSIKTQPSISIREIKLK